MVKMRLQPMLGHATVWLRRKGWIRQRGDRYSSFAALESEQPNGAFSIETVDRGSPITIMAIHGGKIEPRTSSLAKRIANDTFNYYNFSGHKKRHNWDSHITSTVFDEPAALALASRSAVCSRFTVAWAVAPLPTPAAITLNSDNGLKLN